MSLTNFSKWRSYMAGVCSPDNYINWGFYSLISSSLQRRVWITDNRPIYPNMYVILVGDPAVGKGLVIKPVTEILRYHKFIPPSEVQKNGSVTLTEAEKIEKQFKDAVTENDYKLAQSEENSYNGRKAKDEQTFEKPLLIPIAADATTYEALVKAMSRSIRRVNYKKFSAPLNREVSAIYTHSSLSFDLEEIASLFRKRTEDLVNFLLQAYDCGDYTYDTKTQGKDRIRDCCLNILGGTTPDFMQDTFDDKLLNQGFSSRTFYIFATKNRKNVGLIPSLTLEQEECKKDIIKWVGQLINLYGEVKIEQSTKDKFQAWWDSECSNPRNNNSLKMLAYYGRKNLHAIKLAIAMHFGETQDMVLPWSTIEAAIECLKIEEKTMHYALALESDNPLAAVSKKVKDFLRINGEQTRNTMVVEFWGRVREHELDEVINHLIGTNQVVQITKTDEVLHQNVMFYKLK